MMKKLLFNLTATQPSFGVKRHGGGIYGEIVLKKIIEQKRFVIVAYDSSLWLNPDIKNLCELNSVEMIDISKCSMQEVIDKTKPDIFYSPQPLDSLYALKNCDLVVTVHDLRDVEMCIDRKMFWRYKISLKKQLKAEKPAVIFLNTYSITATEDIIQHDGYDTITHYTYKGMHAMMIYGFKDIFYYDEDARLKQRDTFLYASTGSESLPLALLDITRLCTVDDIYITEVI